MELNNRIRSERIEDLLLQFFIVAMACMSIFALRNLWEYLFGMYFPRLYYVIFLPILIVSISGRYKFHIEAKLFIIALCFGCLLHNLFGAQIQSSIPVELLCRIIPVFLLSMYLSTEKKMPLVIAFVLLFYIAECMIALYEKLTLSFLFSYEARGIENGFTRIINLHDINEFRSTSLMCHPLFNANTVSIAIAFILCSNKFHILIKSALIILGILALYSFNSRGVFLVWGLILLYRLVLYKRNKYQVIVLMCLAYLIIPIALFWLSNSGFLGRLSNFDFSDNSTSTRILAFVIFANSSWSLHDIFVGGRLLTYFMSEITLENGILLDLCYWGFLVGPIKIVTEILLSYRALHNYIREDKVIIMLATWAVAMTNNNTQQTWLLPIFVLFFIGLSPYYDKGTSANFQYSVLTNRKSSYCSLL